MSNVISKTTSTVKDTLDDVLDVAKSIPQNARTTLTTKEGGMSLVYAAGGVVFGGLVSGILMKIPFSMIPGGRVLRTLTTLGVGAGIFTYGRKNSGDFGTAMVIGGGTMAVVGLGQVLAMTGLFPGVSNLLMSAEESLEGYTTMDSVTVDASSYQPAQNYGAEGETVEEMATADTPQVQIASNMEADPMDSVRQESAMGHGVTQWFGSEHSSSASPLFRKAPSMKAFNASTDVGGNRTTTGDDSMANVIGGASMKDIPATTSTAYDVSLEMNTTPAHTKEVGGVQDAFNTYILPSYQHASAGDSGRGVTEWYAESNQTGFIGRFMAGAEGHGAVIGQ